MTVQEALDDPYVADFHEQQKEGISCKNTIKIPIDDNVKHTVKEYRHKLYDDILRRKKEIRKKMIDMQKKMTTQK